MPDTSLLFAALGFECNGNQVGKSLGGGRLRHDKMDVTCFGQMYRVYNVHIAAQMTAKYTFQNITCQRLCIHRGQITSVIYLNFTYSLIRDLSGKAAQLLSKREIWLQLRHDVGWYWRHVDRIFKRLITQNMQHLLGHIDSYILLSFDS